MAEPDSNEVLSQFNQLIEEILGGNLNRTTFRPWEIGILVDLASCDLRASSKSESILRHYQKAMQCQMQEGARTPLKLSEYMASLQVSRDQCKLAAKRHATGAPGD